MRKILLTVAFAALALGFAGPVKAQDVDFLTTLAPRGIPREARVIEFRASGNNAARPEVGMDEFRHVRYSDRDNYPIYMNVFRPKGVKDRLPCLMFMPGSAWKKQNIDKQDRFMRSIASRGFVVACVEYRPCSVALFPAPVEDSKTAVRFLRKSAKKFGIDPENIFVGGSSSGGHVTQMHAYTQDSELYDTPLYGKYSCKARGLISLYGPSELVQEFRIFDGSGPEERDANGGLLLGDPVEEKVGVAKSASPLYYVHPGVPPSFIVQGDRDKVVLYKQGAWLAQRLEDVGAAYEFYRVAGAGHGGAVFSSPAMVDLIAAFMESNCKK